MAWFADNQRILFGRGFNGFFSAYVALNDGSDPLLITPASSPGSELLVDHGPAVSPSGTWIASISQLPSPALFLAPRGKRVNAIAPGFIDNRLVPGERGERYDQCNVRAETEMLLEPANLPDMAGAAVYPASDDADM